MTSRYSLEHAKSGRSKCRKCKEPIVKGEIRIGLHSQDPKNPDVVFDHWYHMACFVLPTKLKKQGIDATAFIKDLLEDNTSGQILPSLEGDIIASLAAKPTKKPTKDAKAVDTSMARIKAYLKHDRGEGDGDEGPVKKKFRLTSRDESMLDTYLQYADRTADELKDILGWNRQLKSGNKDLQLARVVDGQMQGRLGFCPVCIKGRLQLLDANAETVVCKGYYDEDLSSRMPCDFSCKALDAPRLLPWYTEEPTEEEKAELDRITGDVKRGSAAKSPKAEAVVKSLVDRAAALDWNLGSTEAIKKATKDLLEIAVQDGKLDLPDDTNKARMAIGRLIAADRSLTSMQAMSMVVDKFGFADSKKDAAADRQSAMEHVCECPENAILLALFHELGDLYFKLGNRNAGGSYRKAEKAIKELPFVITKENALGLCKGKTKVPNIGKGSASKIYEYLTTGKIEKLEEKRAEVS